MRSDLVTGVTCLMLLARTLLGLYIWKVLNKYELSFHPSQGIVDFLSVDVDFILPHSSLKYFTAIRRFKHPLVFRHCSSQRRQNGFRDFDCLFVGDTDTQDSFDVRLTLSGTGD